MPTSFCAAPTDQTVSHCDVQLKINTSLNSLEAFTGYPLSSRVKTIFLLLTKAPYYLKSRSASGQMCPYKDSSRAQIPCPSLPCESHPQGVTVKCREIEAFTPQRTDWKGRKVKQWRAEKICSPKRLIFNFPALPILSSSTKTCIFGCMFQSRGIGKINPATRKVLRTGEHNAFSGSYLLIGKVHDCLWIGFLPLLTEIIPCTHPYETLQQL